MTRTILILAVVVVALSAGLAPPAAAQSDAGPIEGLFDDEGGSGIVKGVLEGVGLGGLLGRAAYTVDSVRSEPDPTPHAEALAETYNANSDTIEDWVNARFNGTAEDWTVLRIDLEQGDTTATRYLVADVSNGTFEDSEMVAETDRSVDATLTFQDYAATQAAAELEYFVTEYAAADRDVTDALRTRMAAYKPNTELPEGL
jgi:hypothetical protein